MKFQGDAVQGVIFVQPGTQQPDALKLWELLFPGDAPDAFNRNTNAPSLLSSALGARNGLHVTLSSQVGRIDIHLRQPQQLGESPDGRPPRISDVPAAADSLVSYLKHLSPHVVGTRFAVVLDTSSTVEAGEDSAAIKELLPEAGFPDHSTDFIFQFNRRRAFEAVPDVQMNRLCTWSMGQILLFVAGPGLQPGMGPGTPYVGFKVDVNTAPESVITRDHSEALIDELCSEAKAIFEQGFDRFR